MIVRFIRRRSAAAGYLPGLGQVVEPDFHVFLADDDLLGDSVHYASLFLGAERRPSGMEVTGFGQDMVA